MKEKRNSQPALPGVNAPRTYALGSEIPPAIRAALEIVADYARGEAEAGLLALEFRRDKGGEVDADEERCLETVINAAEKIELWLARK